jgi:hypothetical protein
MVSHIENQAPLPRFRRSLPIPVTAMYFAFHCQAKRILAQMMGRDAGSIPTNQRHLLEREHFSTAKAC